MTARLRGWAPYLPALAWAALVLFIGTRSRLPGPSLAGQMDKVAHFGAYAVLGALLAWGWLLAGRRPAGWLLVAGAIALGMFEELLQTRIPGRHGDVMDWLADSAGAITGFIVMARLAGARMGRRG